MNRPLRLNLFFAFASLITSGANAGLTVSTYSDQPTWSGAPAIQTTAAPQATLSVNQQVSAGTSLTQTFKTGTDGFQLDAIDIYSGGKGGGTGRLSIYPAPVGGENSDGFVNTSFSTDLLNGGNGLDFTFGGSPGLQYIRLDLTAADEVTLAPNTKYALEIDVVSSLGNVAPRHCIRMGTFTPERPKVASTARRRQTIVANGSRSGVRRIATEEWRSTLPCRSRQHLC